jgi:D-3-phosphoglycerate dehydrogenase
MAKVLVTDSLAAQGLAILEQSPGLEVEDRPDLPPGELLEAIRDAEALVIRSGTKVTADVIAAGEKLRVIGRAGIGIDNVDVAAATARGIVVMNTPEGNNVTTGEHAIALLISLARHIPQATASMKNGRWEKKGFVGMELYIAFDPFITDAAARMLDVELVPFDELLARSDAISVHVPRTKDTVGLIGRDALAKVKPGVLLINAARGGIVDEKALLEALDDGRVAGAALDVFEQEPTPPDHPLVRHDKVICTPHLGASTEQAQVNVSIAVAEQVRDYLLSGLIGNAVNVPSISRELLEQVRPYLVLGEKLGRFQGQLCAGSIEQIEIEYSGEAVELDVTPLTIAVLKGMLESVSDQVNMVNAPLIAQSHGIKVIESKSSHTLDFASAISTRVIGCGERLIVGAIFHGGQPRIVRVDDFMLEAIPEGPTLLLLNHDQPGVVGTVGTVLGEAGLNISRMQLALVPERSEAAMLVNVDPAPPEPVLEQLRSIPHVISAQLVDLGT